MATNELFGLLGPPARECYRGHGKMERVEGDWSLQQVRISRAENKAFPTGTFFVAGLYRCPTCRAVELVDETS